MVALLELFKFILGFESQCNWKKSPCTSSNLFRDLRVNAIIHFQFFIMLIQYTSYMHNWRHNTTLKSLYNVLTRTHSPWMIWPLCFCTCSSLVYELVFVRGNLCMEWYYNRNFSGLSGWARETSIERTTRHASADLYLITPRPCDVKRHCTGLFLSLI